MDAADVDEALAVNADEWRKELPLIEEWFEFVGEKLPTGIKDEFDALKQRLAERADLPASRPQKPPKQAVSGGFCVCSPASQHARGSIATSGRYGRTNNYISCLLSS